MIKNLSAGVPFMDTIIHYFLSAQPAGISGSAGCSLPTPRDSFGVRRGSLRAALVARDFRVAFLISFAPRKTSLCALLGLLLLTAPAARAQFSFTTNSDNTATITGYTGTDGVVSIPTSLNALPVTGIGEGAFLGLTNLTSVVISVSVTNIGYEAFDACSSLTAITVDPQNPFYSSVNGVLFDKSGSRLVQFPGGLSGNYAISENVTSIWYNAFAYSRLTSVTLPGSIAGIGQYAFSYSSLASVTISAGVTFLGAAAFEGCSNLTTLTIPASVTKITQGAFSDCTSLATVSILEGVTNIDLFAFGDCTGLTNISMPNGLTSIGLYAFQGCTNLTSISIPDGVTWVGDSSFEGCTGLTNLTIPASVSGCGACVFQNCSNLTSLYFKGNAPDENSPWLNNYLGNLTIYYLPGTTGWNSSLEGYPTVLWNPVIQTGDASLGVRNNEFGFTVAGTSNIIVVVEACANMAGPAWTRLQTITLTNGLSHFSDPVQTNSASRFYRLHSP